MKGSSNGAGSSLVYGAAIAIATWASILFGCLAMTAEAGRSPHQLLNKKGGRTTRALYLASNTTSVSYHTDDNGLEAYDCEPKTELSTGTSCTKKCYCHSNNKDDICYCCQESCFPTLQGCQGTCPDGTTTVEGHQLHGTKNATL